MADLWLFVVEVLVLAGLVAAYVVLRRRLRDVTATTSGPPEAGAGEPERVRGVLRAGPVLAVFVVVEVDRAGLWVRSRPRFLGLGLAVPRTDVARLSLEPARRGRVPELVLTPVSGRAEGLEQLRLQVRGDSRQLARRLRSLGWPLPPTPSSGSRSGSNAKPRPGR